MDLKEVLRKALDYFGEVYRGVPVEDVLIEEIEKTEDGKYWLVTVGFSVAIRGGTTSPLSELVVGGKQDFRKYKRIKIDDITGEAISMKMRIPKEDEER